MKTTKLLRIQPLRHHLKVMLFLLILYFLLNQLYVVLYSTNNLIRATLIGLSALFILWLPPVRETLRLHPLLGFLSIYASALLAAQKQMDAATNRWFDSIALHALTPVITYIIIMFLYWLYWKSSTRRR